MSSPPSSVTVGTADLPGDYRPAPGGRGLVVFAHGSGSSRLSPRNQQVAAVLQAAGLGTLLFDLLTTEESADRARVFDIGLLAQRVLMAVDAVRAGQGAFAGAATAPIGLFGASTGAAAALVAAATRPDDVQAVVSRGGRPDLAGEALEQVRAPTLLVVGGLDIHVLELNRLALTRLRCEKRLDVVPGATHLFEEPGTLEAAAGLAAEWFAKCLARGSDTAAPAGVGD